MFLRSKLKYLLFITFFILCKEPLNAQAFTTKGESFVVDSIKISGNELTEDFIILRELTFGIGDTVNNDILDFNKERVFSLALFNRVDVFAKDTNGISIVNIDVKESWYIYPVPFLEIDNNDISKANYGFILLWKNFRGRNETVKASVGFGFDPFLLLSYYNPVLWSKHDISFAFSLSYVSVFNKSLSAEKYYGTGFSYRYYSGMIGFGKRLNQFNDLSLVTGYEYIEQPDGALNMFTSSGSSIDRHPVASIKYVYDTRNLKQFSSKGIFTGVELTHKGFGLNSTNYNIFTFDFREYRELFYDIRGRWRFAFRHLFGKQLPFYDRSFLGYNESVRGHTNDYREGDNLIISSFELIYPLLDEWNFSIKLPLLPRRLTSARIGIHLEGFYDIGSTFNNGERLKPDKFDNGYGVGVIVLFLPHNAFRFELGIDEYKNTEFIIGTGFSF